MRLMLHYRGPLYSNGKVEHKHDIRKAFHAQLKTLWAQKPLSEHPSWIQPKRQQSEYWLLRPLGAFTFVPLVSAEMDAVAELSVTILRPEPPGGLITRGGDIDNRVKTLFDALTMPRHSNALPAVSPTETETPFFCLLEDDSLVIAVSVRTEQLLEPIDNPAEVELSIYVRTRVTRGTIGNYPFT